MRCSAFSENLEQLAPPTLVELLRSRAAALGSKQAFSFLQDNCGAEVGITYGEVDAKATAIAGELQALMPAGERALLLFPPGLDFIAAFFGCLYAGVVAVPVALPARNRSTASIEAIDASSSPAVILSTADHGQLAKQLYAHLPALLNRPWIAVDQVSDNRQATWRDPQLDGQHTAFLQYTSGSTSAPKGVILSHQNVVRNAALIHQAFGNSPESKGVFWLPLYHDMGLIGGVIQPIYCGGSGTLMSPAAFLQRPLLWLETISRTRATVSGGPDFAFDLCARKIRPEECRHLDLSSWQVAFTGAERIRAETIERFCDAFAGCGFRREAFFPCYGLAEGTLMVSGGPRQTAPSIIHIRADALQRNQVEEVVQSDVSARTLVGCGGCLAEQRLLIVDPETLEQRQDGHVGEIWVQGPSVASGYFKRAPETQATFHAYLSSGEGPFLRTGDLGFVRDGQLFVTGRRKDVIIIRGRNYYPEDIEHSISRAHPAFRVGYCVAFSIEIENRERLVVIQEIEPRHRDLDVDEALRVSRQVIASQHELEVYDVVLAKAGEISKTSSGKTQRSTCRERYLDSLLQIVARWQTTDDLPEDEAAAAEVLPAPRIVSAEEIEDWLIRRIASVLRLPEQQIQVGTPFLEFGMSSLDAVQMAEELERWLGRRMSPTAIYNYPNIAALARWLADSGSAGKASSEAAERNSSLENTNPDSFEDVRYMTEADMKAFILEEMAKQ